MPVFSKGSLIISGVLQFLKYLALALWLGGFTFFGAVAAPFLFRMARAEKVPQLAPQIVGAMLGRFSFITYLCAALLVAAWLFEWVKNGRRGPNMMLQGLLTSACLTSALYLGTVLLPATIRAQKTFLPIYVRAERGEILTSDEQAQRARFDAGHQLYSSLGSLTVYALMGLLGLSVAQNVALANSVLRRETNP